MPNAFEKALGIPLPKCCNLGECCKGASPSTPYARLLQRAAEGDDFARGFFSLMVPYPSHEAAAKVVPGLVQRTLEAAKKLPDFAESDDIVFYHCRYLLSDNRCGVHEDRPQFCRDYPDTPFVVMAPGCAFESWATACKQKYSDMKTEVEQLKALKEELEVLKQSAMPSNDTNPEHQNLRSSLYIDADTLSRDNTDILSMTLSLTGLYLASPLGSYQIYNHPTFKR